MAYVGRGAASQIDGYGEGQAMSTRTSLLEFSYTPGVGVFAESQNTSTRQSKERREPYSAKEVNRQTHGAADRIARQT